LVPEDFQKITDQMNHLGLQYGYNHMFKRIPLTQTIIPAVPAIAAIVADPTATPPILAVPAVPAIPEQFIFGSFQNLLETYSADNIKTALFNASVVWGDDSFTLQKSTGDSQNDDCQWIGKDANQPQTKRWKGSKSSATLNALKVHGASHFGDS
jgi:hypothetical protein